MAAWICWVTIGSLTGAWNHTLAGLGSSDPRRAAGSLLGIFVALHLLLLSSAIVSSILFDGGLSIARSLRVDRLPPWLVIAFAAVFGLACHWVAGMPIASEVKSNAILAAALALATALATLPHHPETTPAPDPDAVATDSRSPQLLSPDAIGVGLLVIVLMASAASKPRIGSGPPREWLLPLPRIEYDVPERHMRRMDELMAYYKVPYEVRFEGERRIVSVPQEYAHEAAYVFGAVRTLGFPSVRRL